MHYLTREFRVKLHAKTDIARVAKKYRSIQNAREICQLQFVRDRSLLITWGGEDDFRGDQS